MAMVQVLSWGAVYGLIAACIGGMIWDGWHIVSCVRRRRALRSELTEEPAPVEVQPEPAAMVSEPPVMEMQPQIEFWGQRV